MLWCTRSRCYSAFIHFSYPHLRENVGFGISRPTQDISRYIETSLIRHSMGPENNVRLVGCWIMECLLAYLNGDCTSLDGQIRENVGI